ncbi:MAG: hypothetical protein ABJB47_06290 [Actinomycetota bacterium]
MGELVEHVKALARLAGTPGHIVKSLQSIRNCGTVTRVASELDRVLGDRDRLRHLVGFQGVVQGPG